MGTNEQPETDEWGDGCDDAPVVDATGTYEGTLDSEDDEDYFNVQLDHGEYIEIDAYVPTDAYEPRITISGDDFTLREISNLDSTSSTWVDLKPGIEGSFEVWAETDLTLCFRIRDRWDDGNHPYDWQFDLQKHTSAPPDEEWGDECSGAPIIEESGMYDGTLVSPGDEHYFRVQLEHGEYLEIDAYVPTDAYEPRITISGDDFTLREVSNLDSTSSTWVDLEPGIEGSFEVWAETDLTLCFRIRDRWDDGNHPYDWEFDLQKHTSAPPDEAWGDDCADAPVVDEPGVYSGTLVSPDDEHYFKVILSDGDILEVSAFVPTNAYAPRINISGDDFTLQEGSNLDNLASSWVDLEPGVEGSFELVAEADGNYCFRIRDRWDDGDFPYDWEIALGEDPEPPDAGTVTGIVTDADDNPLEGANVTFSEVDTNGADKTASTDVEGGYDMTLSAGTYEATVEVPGFEQITDEITVEEGDTHSLDFSLSVGQVTAITDAGGEYEIKLPAGTYEIVAEADGFGSVSDDVIVEKDETHSRDFILETSDIIEEVLDRYEEAAVTQFENEIEAQARLTAGLFDEHGQELAEHVTEYWGYKAGFLAEEEIDEEVQEAADALLAELTSDDVVDSPEQFAVNTYNFFSELFDTIDDENSYPTVRDTTIAFYFGEYPDQTHELKIDGATPSEIKTELVNELDAQRDDIETLLTEHDPSQAVRNRIANELANAARQLEQEAAEIIEQSQTEVEKLRGDPDEEVPFELVTPEPEEPQLPDLSAELARDAETDAEIQPTAVLGGLGIVGATILASKLAGKVGLGKWIFGTTVLGKGLSMVLSLLKFCTIWLKKKLVLLKKKLITKFKSKFKTKVKEAVARWARTIVERYLVVGTGFIQAEITDIAVSDITEDDEEDRGIVDAFAAIWSSITSLFTGETSVGRQTGTVTVTNTSDVTRFLPHVDVDVRGYSASGQLEDWQSLPGSAHVKYDEEIAWLDPGDAREIAFEYELNKEAFSLGEIHLSLHDYFLSRNAALDTEDAEFNVEGDDGLFFGELLSDALNRGSSVITEYTVGAFTGDEGQELTPTQSTNPELSTISLTYPEQFLDLHVYDKDGNHVGHDYESDEAVIEIPGAEYSGRDRGSAGQEWITLTELADDEYDIEVVAPDDHQTNNLTLSHASETNTDDDELDFTVDVSEVPAQPPELSTLSSSVNMNGKHNESITGVVVVEETNGFQDLTDVSLNVTDLAHIYSEATISATQIDLPDYPFTIEAGGSEILSLDIAIPADAEIGEYSGELEFSADGQSRTVELDVTVQLTQAWTSQTDGQTQLQYSSPAVGTERIFIGGLDETVYALDRSDGDESWTFQRTGALVDSSPVVEDGVVYIGSGEGVLYALAGTDGTVEWEYQTSSAIVSSPTVGEDTVYVGANDGTLHAITLSDGTERWSYTLESAVYTKPAVSDGYVYVTTRDGYVVAVDVATESEDWSVQTAGEFRHAGPVVADETVYVASDKVYAISDGVVAWEASYGGVSGSTPTIKDGILYVGSTTGVHAFDTTTGSVEWGQTTETPVASRPEVVAGRAIVGSVGGTLYIFDATSGEVQATAALTERTYSSPISADGSLYIGDENGQIANFKTNI